MCLQNAFERRRRRKRREWRSREKRGHRFNLALSILLTFEDKATNFFFYCLYIYFLFGEEGGVWCTLAHQKERKRKVISHTICLPPFFIVALYQNRIGLTVILSLLCITQSTKWLPNGGRQKKTYSAIRIITVSIVYQVLKEMRYGAVPCINVCCFS